MAVVEVGVDVFVNIVQTVLERMNELATTKQTKENSPKIDKVICI